MAAQIAMGRFLAPVLLLAASLVPMSGPGADEAVDLELVLAADGSGSIDDNELRFQREGYATAITHPRVLGAIRGGFNQAIAVAYIEWGGPYSQHTIVDWTRIDGPESAAAFARKLTTTPRMAEGYNSISEAIAYATELIAGNAYRGARRIIDVSGDGPQIGGRSLIEVKALAFAHGITINALVVKSPGGGFPGPGGEALEEHYRDDVIGGRGAFVTIAENRKEMAAAILKKLILEIASLPPPKTRPTTEHKER